MASPEHLLERMAEVNSSNSDNVGIKFDKEKRLGLFTLDYQSLIYQGWSSTNGVSQCRYDQF